MTKGRGSHLGFFRTGLFRSSEERASRRAVDFWQRADDTFIAGDSYRETVSAALESDLLPLLEPGDRVLDFGCGDGTFTLEVARRCGEIRAIDLSPRLVERAREAAARAGLDNAHFAVGQSAASVEAEGFDWVICMGVLVCVVDDQEFADLLLQLAGAVRSGGHLVLRETFSGLGPVTWEDGDYVARYRERETHLEFLAPLGFRLAHERQLAVWSEAERRSNHLWILERSQ